MTVEVSTPGPSLIARESLSAVVARRLLAYLQSGAIPIGGRLPSERQLGVHLGVARNAVRDGLKPLALLGIIESRPGSGTYFVGMTSDLLPQVVEWGVLLREHKLNELVEARLHVESTLARLMCERRDDESLAKLKVALAEMEAACHGLQRPEFVAADLAFHLIIANSAQNSILEGIVNNIRALIAAWIKKVVGGESDLEGLYQEHAAIVRAMELGDSDMCAAAMESHLRAVTRRLFDELRAANSDLIG